MKIGFVRFPDSIYQKGLAIKGGSEIASQQLIDSFRQQKNIEIKEFYPNSPERLALYGIPALGTPLMFQGLQQSIDEINSCDLLFTSHWFSLIIPEIKIPVVTLFHHNAKLVLDCYENNPSAVEKEMFGKWLEKMAECGLAQKSSQFIHDEIISISERYAVHNSQKSVSVSNYLKKTLIDDYQVSPDKIEVIYYNNPIEWEKRNFAMKPLEDKPTVINITRLPVDFEGIKLKGVDRVFEIFSRLKGCQKIIIGSTNQPDKYNKLITKYLPGVEFKPNRNRNQLFDQLCQSRISLQASRCESFGLSTSESMLLGNVPVAFPTGVVEELIKNGENGFVVNSVEEAVEKINFLTSDPLAMERMSAKARETVLEKCDSKKITQSYLNLIKNIIK